MKSSIIPAAERALFEENTFWLDRIARRLVIAQLNKIEEGEITVIDNEDKHVFGRMTKKFPVRVQIDIQHSSIWSDVAFGGSSGSGEAYMKGSWRCSNLVDLVRIFLRNRHVLNGLDKRLLRLKQPLHRIIHWLSRNTRSGSKRNISAHYDLGNEFFQLFLDPTMMYSSAYYPSAHSTLEEASVAKLDLICRKLKLTPDDHVLEIGTGWGGFAIHAVKNYGCRVTTTTISQEQYQLAEARVQHEGLTDRIEVLSSDYRDLEGQYDKLVSIEMIEAIGHQYLDTYFSKCNELLKPNGEMLLQAITIRDQNYHTALRQVDFIKKFIFPGGFLPSITAMSQSISEVTSMQLSHLEDIGHHYARTLSDWRHTFLQRIDEVKKLGYPESFIRMWEYYFCYCEGGFTERDIGTVQMVLTKK